MATLLVLYHQPTDPTAFDAHYTQTHIPLAKQVPGLRSYTISAGPVTIRKRLYFQKVEGLARICRFEHAIDTLPGALWAGFDGDTLKSIGTGRRDLHQLKEGFAVSGSTELAERLSRTVWGTA